jgi:hypothetical protein
MAESTNKTPMIPTAESKCTRLELANQLFREFHTRCFWHSPRTLIVTEDLIPFVAKGLRTHGGRRGFLLADKLDSSGTMCDPAPETPKCR